MIKSGFLEDYKNTNFGALFTTNFSWHFHESLDNLKENEIMVIFHTGEKYSLKPEAVHFLKIAAEQYGFVPAKLEEREQVDKS